VSAAVAVASGWPLRRRQVWQVMRAELGRTFSFWRTLWLLALALVPVVIVGGHALEDQRCNLEEETLILAGIIQAYYVRFAIFFGCLWTFVRLVRGEVAERTLHYWFLAPLRRDVLIAGKFLAGVASTVLIFTTGMTACFALMYAHFPQGREFAAHGPALAHYQAYVLVTVLACIGYGAVFLAMSLVFRNPIVPAAIVLGWEGLNGVLPPLLKRFSVIFYLKPLFPVELPVVGITGLFTVVAEPVPAWVAVTGLLAFACAVVVFACWRIRRLEVSYSTD
jgi:ABC-type transport system involved in multi-copper enzyme maturation permease subunit